MTEPKPLRRPKSPVSADSSAVLAYLSELESYTSAIERAGRQLVADVRLAESAWADHAGAHLQTIARLEAELGLKRGVLDQVQGELTAARDELIVLRELAADVGRWRETGGDPRDLNYILETLEKYHALAI